MGEVKKHRERNLKAVFNIKYYNLKEIKKQKTRQNCCLHNIILVLWKKIHKGPKRRIERITAGRSSPFSSRKIFPLLWDGLKTPWSSNHSIKTFKKILLYIKPSWFFFSADILSRSNFHVDLIEAICLKILW